MAFRDAADQVFFNPWVTHILTGNPMGGLGLSIFLIFDPWVYGLGRVVCNPTHGLGWVDPWAPIYWPNLLDKWIFSQIVRLSISSCHFPLRSYLIEIFCFYFLDAKSKQMFVTYFGNRIDNRRLRIRVSS